MSMMRRDFLKFGGAMALFGVTGLSGCLTQADPVPEKYPPVPVEPDYQSWFSGVSNYDHTRDARGESAVEIEVGVSANNGKLGFGPAAVAVSPGTVVTWTWTGKGGPHNVVAKSGAFDSGNAVQSSTKTFQFTFDEPRIYEYVCEPHEMMGMKGAVFVALGPRGS